MLSPHFLLLLPAKIHTSILHYLNKYTTPSTFCQAFSLFYFSKWYSKNTEKDYSSHKKHAFTDTVFMQKKSLPNVFLSTLFLFSSLSACQKSANSTASLPDFSSSSPHVPTPLPIFPDKEDTPLSHCPLDESTEMPSSNLWDVSAVDISKIDCNRKLIAFTFDDTPARRLENILAIYADYNEENPDCIASATLFINGCLFDNHTPVLLSTALALGFELGNHTYSHADLTELTDTETATEIQRVDKLLSKIDGKTHHLLRPPYGKITPTQKSASHTPIINWAIDTLDWTGIDAEEIYQNVMENKFSGAIVLMHDKHENTLLALKRLLPALKAEGYQVVSVSQMSKAHACALHNGGEYIRIRKH